MIGQAAVPGQGLHRLPAAHHRLQRGERAHPLHHGVGGEQRPWRPVSALQLCPQCAAGLQADGAAVCGDRARCGRLVGAWQPGSAGEVLGGGGALVAGGRGALLLLEVEYNPGTGWLHDSSGLEMFYTDQEPDNKVLSSPSWTQHTLTVTMLQVSRVVVRPGVCSASCLAQPAPLLSATLLGAATLATLGAGDTVAVAGARPEYSPTRHLQPGLATQRGLQLSCGAGAGAGSCWAAVTLAGETNTTECGTGDTGTSYCVTRGQTQNIGAVLTADTALPHIT